MSDKRIPRSKPFETNITFRCIQCPECPPVEESAAILTMRGCYCLKCMHHFRKISGRWKRDFEEERRIKDGIRRLLSGPEWDKWKVKTKRSKTRRFLGKRFLDWLKTNNYQMYIQFEREAAKALMEAHPDKPPAPTPQPAPKPDEPPKVEEPCKCGRCGRHFKTHDDLVEHLREGDAAWGHELPKEG